MYNYQWKNNCAVLSHRIFNAFRYTGTSQMTCLWEKILFTGSKKNIKPLRVDQFYASSLLCDLISCWQCYFWTTRYSKASLTLVLRINKLDNWSQITKKSKMYLLIKFIFAATKPTSCKQCNAIRITKITNIKPKICFSCSEAMQYTQCGFRISLSLSCV